MNNLDQYKIKTLERATHAFNYTDWFGTHYHFVPLKNGHIRILKLPSIPTRLRIFRHLKTHGHICPSCKSHLSLNKYYEFECNNNKNNGTHWYRRHINEVVQLEFFRMKQDRKFLFPDYKDEL